jgi:HD-GYP domain-containing protein (c-di-GMP phosphodiesterase class II)
MQTAPDPVAEQLLEDARRRRRASLAGRERPTRWATAILFAAAAVSLALLAPAGRETSWLLVAVLTLSYAVASRVQFEIGAGYALPTEVVVVPMLFALPARVVPLCVAAGLVAGRLPSVARRELPVERLVVGVGNATYSLGPALVFLAAGEPSAHLRGWGVLALALLAQGAVDSTSSIAREWFALRVPPRELVRPLASAFAIDVLLAPVGLSAAVGALSTEAALVLPLPLLGLIAFFARERRRRLDHSLELSSAYRGTALLLGDVLDSDDAYTGSHSRAVVELVLGVADRLGLGARERRTSEFVALLHDVGKIRIPTAIIVKPGPLTPDEREIINTHTIEGERMLLSIGGLLADVGRIVRSCHERFDGRGYPDRLAGDEIPLIARIVCCCDAYNAMTTDRPYRRALTHEAAVGELLAGRGAQFDPAAVDALLEVLAERRADVPLVALHAAI